MAPQASKKCGLLPPDHYRIAVSRIGITSCTSNGLNSEQVPGSFSVLTISSLSPQASAQSGKKFLSGLKFLLHPQYPGLSRNQGFAHGTVSTIGPHGA